MNNDLVQRCKNIKMVLTDVDGVLTDAGMYYSERGDELKKFSTWDGGGFMLLRHVGIKAGLITGEQTEIVARRAHKLQLDFLAQNVKNKQQVLQALLESENLTAAEIAYMGDDINDLMVLQMAGVSATVPDHFLPQDVRVDYVTARRGGCGAVREFCEWLLHQRGDYDRAISSYLQSISR